MRALWYHPDTSLVLSHSVLFDSLRRHGLLPIRVLCLWTFSRQEYWSGLSFPFPGYLLNPEIEPGSPALWADSLPSEPPGKPRERKTQREKENRVLCLLPYPLMISLEAEGGE